MFYRLRYLLLFTAIALLNACAHAPEKTSGADAVAPAPAAPATAKRYVGKDRDWGPTAEIDMSHVPDAQPRYELRTIAGNKNPYTVLGKTYSLMSDERGYRERGKASWYGYKFNGEHTSNGDLYDMFGMTAAHKTLPIPSYVRVTNTDNGKTVVVRVNDRGPFHGDRIIDLSYAAAQRLGITRVGTGNVEVEVLVPEDDPRPPLRGNKKSAVAANNKKNVKPLASEPVKEYVSATTYSPEIRSPSHATSAAPSGTFAQPYLQIAAFGVESSAKQFVSHMESQITYPVIISRVDNPQKLYRVRVGPFDSPQKLEQARDQLQKMNVLQTYVVY